MTSLDAGTQAARATGPALLAAQWLAEARFEALPPATIAAARAALTDWFACVMAGRSAPVTQLVARRALLYAPGGSVRLLTGGRTTAPFAALVHATAAHAHDFDDTHIGTDAHFGGPTWAALLAIAVRSRQRLDDRQCCVAYVAGFQVGAKLGGRRLGHAMAQRGFQATGLLARISAAAACALLDRHDVRQTAMALALAASQSSGLTATFGTMTKPFQAGKAAFDGVCAADLARDGFEASPAILEDGGGLAAALVQDGSATVAVPELDSGWEVLRNSTKAYPCLHGIHPTIDAARELSARTEAADIASARAFVAPGVSKIGHFIDPTDVHQAKFSVPYCTALGLLGSRVTLEDFTDAALRRSDVRDLLRRVEVIPDAGRKMYNSAVEVTLNGGEVLRADVAMARGHPARPLTQQELEMKFMEAARHQGGVEGAALLEVLSQFPAQGTLERALAML